MVSLTQSQSELFEQSHFLPKLYMVLEYSACCRQQSVLGMVGHQGRIYCIKLVCKNRAIFVCHAISGISELSKLTGSVSVLTDMSSEAQLTHIW